MGKRLAAGLVLLLGLILLQATCAAEVDHITDKCRFYVSEGKASDITDASMNTAWKPSGPNPEVRISLPDSGAASIQIHWTIEPTNFTLTEYDADQNVIFTRTLEDEGMFPCLSQLYMLQVNTRYISLTFSQSKQGINKIRVFPEGELPKTVVEWQPPLEKCDLMVVSTHQDDEWLWFGGIIPYYDLVQDKDVQVVYMANCGRYRYAEALNSLAVAGVRTYPFFLGLKDQRDDSVNAAIRTWNGKDAIMRVMVAMIRRFKPEVILTHDRKGEYGHPQHIVTSLAMEYVIEAAADPEQYPESAELYGTWQVKKLYRHLEKTDQIKFDWHVPYPEFGGRTGLQVAKDSMNEHASQLKYFQVKDGGQYDNSLFGLSYSVVGRDEKHDDLFENIADATPEPTLEPTPAPTAEPTPEPEPTAEAEPEATADIAAEAASQPESSPEPSVAPTAEPQPVQERGGSAAPIFIAVAVAAAGAGIGGWVLYSRAQAKRKRRRRRRSASRTGARVSASRSASASRTAAARRTGTSHASGTTRRTNTTTRSRTR